MFLLLNGPQASMCVGQIPTNESLVAEFRSALLDSRPISGIFVLKGTRNKEMAQELFQGMEEEAKSKGQKLVVPPDNTLLRCRWSWDGSTELLEPLEESNIWRSFYSSNAGLLDGAEEGNFNLMAPKNAYPIRPINFYFSGGGRLLDWYLDGGTVSVVEGDGLEKVHPQEINDGISTATLIARRDKLHANILIDRANKRILAAEFFSDGNLLSTIQIHKFYEDSDGRAFPSQAQLLLYVPPRTSVFDTISLTAEDVWFPRTREALQDAMEFNLEPGTKLYDLMLDKMVVLKTATSARDIIEGKIPFVSMDTPSLAYDYANSRHQWGVTKQYFFYGTVAIVLLLAFLVVRKRFSPSRS